MCKKFAKAISNGIFDGDYYHLILFMFLIDSSTSPYLNTVYLTPLLRRFQETYPITVHSLMTTSADHKLWAFMNAKLPTQLGQWREVICHFYALIMEFQSPSEVSLITSSWGIARQYPDFAKETILWNNICSVVDNRRLARWTRHSRQEALKIIILSIYCRTGVQINPLRKLSRWFTRINLTHIFSYLLYIPIQMRIN